MKIEIPCDHIGELRLLSAALGEPMRVVGGCVRDTVANAVLSRPPVKVKDIDLATPARPEAVIEAAERLGYRVIPTGLQHGTVTVVIGDEPYEITTLRADVETDGRHAVVEFVSDYKVDASRRDFTINAMSADLDGNVFDYFGGVDDLKAGIVRFVGDADARIREDYLRILRFFRFRERFGGNEGEDSLSTMAKHVAGLDIISGERIWAEISKIAVAARGLAALYDMHSAGILDRVGFELDLRRGRVLGLLTHRELVMDRPALVLGTVARDASSLAATAERWRMSTTETAQAMTAAEIKATVFAALAVTDGTVFDPHGWTCRIVNGTSRATVVDMLTVLGLGDTAREIPETAPVFPLKGADLMAEGMKPGREIGERLRELRAAWMASRFSLDAGSLIEMHRARPNGTAQPTEGYRP